MKIREWAIAAFRKVKPDWKAVDIANRKVLDALEEAGL